MALAFGSIAAASNGCPVELITIHSNQDLHLQLVSKRSAFRSTEVVLYSTGRPIRTLVTNSDGEVNFGMLAEGSYQVSSRSWGKLDVQVRPEKGMNGPLVIWSLPEFDSRFVGPDEFTVRVCPILIEVAD